MIHQEIVTQVKAEGKRIDRRLRIAESHEAGNTLRVWDEDNEESISVWVTDEVKG